MATYRLGSTGKEVRTIQERPRALELYLGPVDGSFSGGTAAAVRRFQTSKRLEVSARPTATGASRSPARSRRAPASPTASRVSGDFDG